MENLDNLSVGLVLSGAIGLLAYRRGSLARSGVFGAALVGTVIFGLGGWVWGLILIAFFVSSSALSHYREAAKASLAEKFAKGHRRDIGQTLANGGVGAILALAFALWKEPILFAAFVGAMATVNADTWGTELGVLNPAPPRLITSGQRVEVGTSGAVSQLGMVASLAGALFIGLVAFLLWLAERVFAGASDPLAYLWAIPTALVAGLAGSVWDSLLGATVQAMYHCPRCAKDTEKSLHGCGTPTEYRRGWRWLNNDMVNLVSSAAGALAAAVVFLVL